MGEITPGTREDQGWEAPHHDRRLRDWRTRTGGCAGTRDGKTRTRDARRPGAGGSGT